MNPYISSFNQALENNVVKSLMKTDIREWDEEIIKDLFNESDQIKILNTPIMDDRNEDVLVWRKENSGIYSVKSAYRFIQSQRGMEFTNDGDNIWKKLWSLKAQPKALNLVWRALSLSLPTMSQLRLKQVNVSNICPVCQGAEETIIHSLVTCQVAARCWEIVLQGMVCSETSNFANWVFFILSHSNQRKRAEVISLCWSIWKARNEIVWNKKRTTVNKIVVMAKQYLLQWKTAQNMSSNAILQPAVEGDGACIWVKPQTDKLKITVDATIFEQQEAMGTGLVIRDSTGEIVYAQTKMFPGVLNPTRAEAIAVKEALSWCDREQRKNVIIESDCLVIVQAIRSVAPMRSDVGLVIEECRKYLRRLNNIELYFIKRSANMVAHTLARVSYLYSERSFDRNTIPIEVKNVLDMDLI